MDSVMMENSGFVAGTLVTTDKGKVPIEDIKVGDLILSKPVLSKPEDGTGEPTFKPVLKTFVHEEKPIWMVRAEKSSEHLDKSGKMIDLDAFDLATRTIDFLATPNHPVWVVGTSSPKDRPNVVFYDNPHWKRVDELLKHEVAVNADGVMYIFTDVQPLYRFAHPDVEANPNYYWYEKNYGKDYEQDYLYGKVKPDFDVTEEAFKTVGYVKNIGNYNECGLLGRFVEDNVGDVELTNSLRDVNGQFIPFTTTVYNMEVADNHTYFIDDAKLWVHNDNCEKTAKNNHSMSMEQDMVGCFVGGTHVQVDSEDKIISIQNVQAGDKVLSKPESGDGEAVYKPVTQTFMYHDKPIWLLMVEKINHFFDKDGNRVSYKLHDRASRDIEVLVTPNHPVWIVGTTKNNRDVEFYDTPRWTRVDALQRYEVAVNQDGVMYSVQRAQPVYQYQAAGDTEVNPDLYWYQKHYYEDYEQDYLYGEFKTDFDVSEADYKAIGYVYDVSKYELNGVGEAYIDECTNHLTDDNHEYIPFMRTVYNLEVVDYHTYYIGITGLWVHDASKI